jgi:hypothetical protein
MQLDEYEIDYVKYFIQVKGYGQYEVLAEILDHFVLLLEEKKGENPTTSFENLVDDAYATIGKSMFKEINRSTVERITKKYKSILAKNSIAFLHYKYVLIMAFAGFLLYHLQSLIHSGMDYPPDKFNGIFGFSIYIFIFLGGKYTTAAKIGNPKFMCNKIAKRYGYYLFVAMMAFEAIIRIVIHPISFGFNMYYLISAVAMVVQIVVLYVIIKTAKDIVQESEVMEETYQVLK